MGRFDATAFLTALFDDDGPELDSRPASGSQLVTVRTWADLPADWRVDFEERAAIREYDGGQAREHAEAEALAEIIAAMERQGYRVIRPKA